MVKVYVRAILGGKITLFDVPLKWYDDVKAALEALEAEEETEEVEE